MTRAALELAPCGSPTRLSTRGEGRPVAAAVHDGDARAAVTPPWLRFVLAVGGASGIALLLPILQPLDNAAFLAVNGLGDGPEWVYGAFDPHNRNYLLLALGTSVSALVGHRQLRDLTGAALTLLLAAGLAMVALELIQLLVDRARPEEVLGARADLTHGRQWAPLASFPSGHMMVTAALTAAAARIAPALRPVLLVYLPLVGLTRVLFGAHFPLDVFVGAAVGYQAGLLAVRLTRTTDAHSVAVNLRPSRAGT
jgi:undecaprenyl-diphosphatase